ncbi:NAD-dependent epimerase/dehydratase family protein, partial [Mycobacterium tuberculosis]|nr:NAD-dependent epimerase/dehydratase family protein [Mycobacterium tuberculosis]
MKILLTGSSGRIGRAIFGALAAAHEVVGLDRSPFATTRIIADVTDRQAVTRAVQGVDAVIHTAALHAPHV